MLRQERGSAPVESVFAIATLVVLTLGALQVGFALYARNVVASAAHEGARAVVERGAVAGDAREVAAAVVERSAGGLVDRLSVDVAATSRAVRVHVRAVTSRFGPLPVAVPLQATATSFLGWP